MESKSPIAGSNGSLSRPAILGLGKLLFLGLSQVSYVSAAPVTQFLGITKEKEDLPRDAEDPSLWLYFGVAAVLVLLGGAFAGLTIALMGQDSIYLQVIATSGEGKEQKHAHKVLTLLQRGKHWVLVTLLLANVMVNESLPIVLDRSLGGGWPAVVGSTALIVIFGEVIPQAVCVRYGLAIGAFMHPFVVALMWLLAPIAWPTAQLLDWALGEDHGTTYKKSGLKTLVTLHKTLGSSPTDRLNQDEVTIISAVLDLKDKAVGDIMTPMEDVFTMSADTILDEHTMNIILSAGYSRIPIYEPGNEGNFVGMLLVKILITYDPEDCKKVSAFALATLPETRAETSCLDIVNFFQEGKSHMVLVSEYPGENYGAIGVVTLEDVIEELIGEEIIDESDVFIDVHKAIRRVAPAPKARMQKTHVVGSTDASSLHAPEDHLIDLTEGQRPEITKVISKGTSRSNSPARFGTSAKTTFLRRGSSGAEGRNIPVRGNFDDMREHLKHLGPSNLASRPKTTRYNTVKIKSANQPSRSESRTDSTAPAPHEYIVEEPYRDDPAPFGGEGEGLLKSAGKEASDGVQAVQQGYGSFDPTTPPNPSKPAKSEATYQDGAADAKHSPPDYSSASSQKIRFSRNGTAHSESSDTVGSLNSGRGLNKRKKTITRSGSITENVIEAGGVRKVVLETTSSSSDKEDGQSSKGNENIFPSSARSRLGGQLDGADDHDEATSAETKGEEVKKKRKRSRHKKKGGKNSEEGSTTSQ
ncbi:Protein MAM3 [Lachnellula occidentalis]|uniref:Protein MAM3 n=1 Tax=Lachnellula occidentalis TaxID=215460 RepID=A0A8H8UIU2_9HELO|nr:Protein MAM3 [Lachnellula occidentalis]